MQLGFAPALTTQIVQEHKRELRRARGGWCVRALAEHVQMPFPRQSTLPDAYVEALEHAYGFEQIVDSRPSPSGSIRGWARGSRLPSLKSKHALLIQTAGAVDLDQYLSHPLADVAALDPPPLRWLQSQIANAPHKLKLLAGLPRLDGPVVAPAVVTRRQCQRVRDDGSVDALLLLLVLARHAELTEDFDAHRAPAQAAWDLLPRVIAGTPWLQGNWRAFAACLHRVLWARLYDSRLLTGPPLSDLIGNIEKKLKDETVPIALLAGPVEPKSRQAVRELMSARFEIEQLFEVASKRAVVTSVCEQIDKLICIVQKLELREMPVPRTSATGQRSRGDSR